MPSPPLLYGRCPSSDRLIRFAFRRTLLPAKSPHQIFGRLPTPFGGPLRFLNIPPADPSPAVGGTSSVESFSFTVGLTSPSSASPALSSPTGLTDGGLASTSLLASFLIPGAPVELDVLSLMAGKSSSEPPPKSATRSLRLNLKLRGSSSSSSSSRLRTGRLEMPSNEPGSVLESVEGGGGGGGGATTSHSPAWPIVSSRPGATGSSLKPRSAAVV